MNTLSRSVASCATLALALCAALAHAEPSQMKDVQCSPGSHAAGEGTPVRTVAVGLAGYSPVSYLDDRKAEPGSPAISAEYQGTTYYFVSAKQRETFNASPEKYLPAYGGTCAFGCSVESTFVPDPTSFEIVDGRTTLFLKNEKVDAKALWNKDPVAAKAKADAFFAKAHEGKSLAYEGARNVGADGVALAGYSPVSYIENNRAERGRSEFSVVNHGITYFLTSAEQVKTFKANPDKYEPQCGGWCAFGMSVQDKFPIDPTKFKVVDGKLYLFLNNSNVDALSLWNKGSESEEIQKANAHWKKVSGN